jgi:hypothetical protein
MCSTHCSKTPQFHQTVAKLVLLGFNGLLWRMLRRIDNIKTIDASGFISAVRLLEMSLIPWNRLRIWPSAFEAGARCCGHAAKMRGWWSQFLRKPTRGFGRAVHPGQRGFAQ